MLKNVKGYYNMKRCVMIDLETLGLKPDAAIASIGAIPFALNVNKYSNSFAGDTAVGFYSPVNIADSVKYGSVCGDTLQFWLSQPRNSQKELIQDTTGTLENEIMNFALWFKKLGEIDEVWANGLNDFNWISNAFEKTGIQKPWRYYQERDFRTAKSMLPEVEVEDCQIAHHALHDAILQAKYLCCAFNK